MKGSSSCLETMKITLVVPAYNEEKRIHGFLTGLVKTTLPIILVDDGSKDRTVDIAQKHHVHVYKHRVNLGKGAAIKTGCDAAFALGADAVIMMDSDGQHNIDDLQKFIKALKTNKYDIVYGSRNMGMGVPVIRFTGNKIASVLVRILFGTYVSDLLCGYRAFTKTAYPKLAWQSTGYEIETEMVINAAKNRLRYCEVPVETIYYEKFKGVTIFDGVNIFMNIFLWRVIK